MNLKLNQFFIALLFAISLTTCILLVNSYWQYVAIILALFDSFHLQLVLAMLGNDNSGANRMKFITLATLPVATYLAIRPCRRDMWKSSPAGIFMFLMGRERAFILE